MGNGNERATFQVVIDQEAEACGGWVYAQRGNHRLLILAPTLTPAGRAAAFTQAFRWFENETRRAVYSTT